MKKKTKHNPQDTTFRNINHLKKEIALIWKHIFNLRCLLDDQGLMISKLWPKGEARKDWKSAFRKKK